MASVVGTDRYQLTVIQAYVGFASKDKHPIENGIEKLIQLLQDVKDHIPSLLAVAYGYLLKNDTTKAKNTLKRISKLKIDMTYITELEHAWLLLAENYNDTQGKLEVTVELCKRVIAHNKSAVRGYEMLGAVYEKQGKHEDAAECYEVAWKHIGTSSASASVGYKLAFNYLKAKRFVEACDICHKVLSLDPQYPKIRKEILAKARDNLRP
jgi:tetratricopeptide repeat protein 21B